MNKMYVWVITAITLILLPVSLFAQAPDTVWTRRYNGPSNDNEFAAGCAVDGSGNIYVTGTYPIGGHEEYLIIKYNADGDTLWIRQYYNPAYSWNIVRACAVDSSGNLYVTGCGNDNYLTVKFNSAGDTLWSRIYDESPYNEKATGCAVDNLGNLYVTGYSHIYYLTIKYNADGDTLWTRRYHVPGNYSDYAYSCATDDSGNCYVTGATLNDTTNWDYLTVKYNAAGDTLWSRQYNGFTNGWDAAYGCVVDGLGNLYVTGESSGLNSDCLTIKYNANGDTLWTRRYDPYTADDAALGCIVDSMDNLYLIGAWGSGPSDYLTIKYNAAGDTLWSCRYGASNDDYATGCAIDGAGNLYVTGRSSNGTNLDLLTIKYNTATGIAGKPECPTINNKLRLEQNKPNPFDRYTTIGYHLPASGPVNLKIYNIAGKLVKTFDMGIQQPGYHHLEWHVSKISAGVYFYRLTSGVYQATKKLVVIK